jgi:hypothetical protein
MLLVWALGVMLGAYSLPAKGQSLAESSMTGLRPIEGGRTALEAFYTRVGVDAGGQTTRAGAIGGRLMWALDPVASASSALPAAIASRTSLGVFGAFTPETRVSAAQLGLAADVTPFRRLLDGRVEPFVSLGAGALHTSTRSGTFDLRPSWRPLVLPEPSGTTTASSVEQTSFLLVPSAGARVQVRPGVAVQGDVRRLVTFDGRARQEPTFGTGLRLTF